MLKTKEVLNKYSAIYKLEIVSKTIHLNGTGFNQWCLLNGLDSKLVESWREDALLGLELKIDDSFIELLMENRDLKEKIKSLEKSCSESGYTPICFF